MRDLRFEAMCAHPEGKGIPESAEVRWERETAQALSVENRVDEWHHKVSTGPRPLWLRVLGQVAAIIGLVALVCAWAFFGDVSGGWPA